MPSPELHAVTGAFGYSGRYIARRLLAAGHRVITLTNSPPGDDPLGAQVRAHPLCFAEPDKLAESLAGVSTLYNTYWVRFNHRDFRFAQAVENTDRLFHAARKAGVGRIVHVSITNPSEESPLEYFRGKARIERLLTRSGLSHAILRPAVLFGKEDILLNNIAWALRRLPVFGVFGKGDYRLQPIYVDDLAALAVDQGDRKESVILDAIGPETFTYRELVATLGDIIGKRRPVISVPPALGFLFCFLLGKALGDVLITRDEIAGLMDGLLHVSSQSVDPLVKTKLTDWAGQNRENLGRIYASELARRKRGQA